MINPPHLGIEWLDALRVLLPHIVAIGSVIGLGLLPVFERLTHEAHREKLD